MAILQSIFPLVEKYAYPHETYIRGQVSNHDRALPQRQVEATDAVIDKLVYDLYGLMD